MLVQEIMTAPVVTIYENAKIRDAVTLLLEHDISGLPVVDSNKYLVGVLSESDLVISESSGQGKHPFINEMIKLLTHEEVILKNAQESLAAQIEKMSNEIVQNYMTKPVVALYQDDSVEEAAKLITKNNINRIPIMNANRQVVGIVTRHDLLKALY